MFLFCCFDVHVIKPKSCNVESILIRKSTHALATLVHIAILGVSSILVYEGTQGRYNGGDLSLIIPNSISIVLVVWILLCSIFGFGCSKMEEIIEEERSPVRLVRQLFF